MALCCRCRQAFQRRLIPITFSSIRYASTVPASDNATPATPPPAITTPNAPDATSSANPASSQPFSTPHTIPASIAKAAKPKKARRIPSSVSGGKELKGLGYTKAQPTIIAKEDDEYPEWLWTLLDKAADTEAGAQADVASMTKKARAKYERKQERLRAAMPEKIPLHEQSRDLTGPEDDAFTSLQRRQELTKSAREARRKKIREDNFLKSM